MRIDAHRPICEIAQLNSFFCNVKNNILNNILRVFFLMVIYRYFFIAKMDYEAPISRLNDDCIYHLLRIMNIASILVFGCTNTRFRAIAYDFISTMQRRTDIHFVLNNPVDIMREILLHFGMHFIILDVQFRQEIIDMNIFQDEVEGCNISHCRELHLFAFMNEGEIKVYDKNYDHDDDDDSDQEWKQYPYGDYYDSSVSIPPMLDRFRINAENIIMSINSIEIPNLRFLTYNFDFFLTPNSYNMDEWGEQIKPILRNLFSGLRRGHMTYNHTHDNSTYNIRLILEFHF